MSNILRSRYPDVDIPQNVSLAHFMLKAFEAYSDNVALISPQFNKSYTFADVIQLSTRLAYGLHSEVGIRKGDVVTTCSANYMELIPLMLGTGLIGATVNTANPAYTVRELMNQFSDCRPRCVVTTSDVVTKLKEVNKKCKFIQFIITIDVPVNGCLFLPDLMNQSHNGFEFPEVNAKDDLAFLLNSSGTTGVPKAVMLTNHSVISDLCQISPRFLKAPSSSLFGPKRGDVAASSFPMFHIGGIVFCNYWMLLNGATSLVMHRFEPVAFLKAVRDYKANIIIVPPPVLVHYTKSPAATAEDFESVKYVICGAAAMGKTLSEAVAAKVKPDYILQYYGATELSPATTGSPLNPVTWQKHGSCGVLLPNTEAKVVDIETGAALGPFQQGEICHRGPQVMKGYFNNPTATRQAIDPDGWFHTGDVGYYDDDEYLYCVDRIKDTIKVKGFQVAPAELEGLILTHPSVEDAVVVGIPDAYAGEVPRAYVVPKPRARVNEEEIKDFISGQVISYKRLEGGIRLVDSIPKTASGKALRREFREKASKEIKSKL